MATEAVTETRYRIGDLARLGGPAASTLRTWQERYPGLLRPTRTAGGHRLYTGEDLAAVRAMRLLVAAGHTVSGAAADVIRHRDRGRPPRDDVTGDQRLRAGRRPTEAGQTWWASSATEELDALRAAHQATRVFLRATSVPEVAAAIVDFVDHIGGAVRPAQDGDSTALPLDISLGVGDPVLAHAPGGSPARRRLEALLPVLVEDARLAAGRLRAGHNRHTRSRSRSTRSG